MNSHIILFYVHPLLFIYFNYQTNPTVLLPYTQNLIARPLPDTSPTL